MGSTRCGVTVGVDRFGGPGALPGRTMPPMSQLDDDTAANAVRRESAAASLLPVTCFDPLWPQCVACYSSGHTAPSYPWSQTGLVAQSNRPSAHHSRHTTAQHGTSNGISIAKSSKPPAAITGESEQSSRR